MQCAARRTRSASIKVTEHVEIDSWGWAGVGPWMVTIIPTLGATWCCTSPGPAQRTFSHAGGDALSQIQNGSYLGTVVPGPWGKTGSVQPLGRKGSQLVMLSWPAAWLGRLSPLP
jgi:hypothetical protein